MASLPPPLTTRIATLTLIALILALPWTRIRRQGRGHALTRLIHHRHGCRCWHHLCRHLGDNGAKDNGHGNRQGHHADIRCQEEVEHHDPIGVEQQKQKQKQKTRSTTVAATSPPLHLQTATPVQLLLLLCVSRDSSDGSTGVAVEAAGPLRV
jgi:hypothetical protein